MKKLFPPEFINRVDEKVYFNSLTREDLHKIIDLELKDLKARVQEAGYKLVVTPSAKEFVADAGKGAGGTLRVSLSKDKEHTRVTRTASHQ